MLGSRGGFLAALMLAVAPIMVAESKLATTDATLTFWMVGGLCCLVELARKPSQLLAGLFWVCLGLACLTKGPIAPVFFLASAASGLVVGLAGPAGVEAASRSPGPGGPRGVDGARGTWSLPWSRAASSSGSRSGPSSSSAPPARWKSMEDFPAITSPSPRFAFYPWSALVPAAVWGAWTRRRTRAELPLLLGWVIGPWLLLECLPTRLLHYYLPAYPACALLVAWMVETVAAEEVSLRRWPLGRLGLGVLGGIGIGGTVGLLAAAVTLPGSLRLPLALLSLLVGTGTLTGMLRLHEGASRRAALELGAIWAAIFLVTGGWLIPAAEPYRTSRRVGQRLAALSAETGVEPVLLNYQEPGVIYAMGRPVAGFRDPAGFRELLDRRGSLLTVVTPEERVAFSSKHGIEVEPIETLEGFSLTKGQNHSLELAIVKRPARRASGLRSQRRDGPARSSRS